MDTIEESYVFVKTLNPHVCTQRRLAPVCFDAQASRLSLPVSSGKRRSPGESL